MIVGLCGGGVMGRGIALTSLLHGHTVIVADVNDAVLEKSISWIHSQLDNAVEKKKINATEAKTMRAALQYGSQLDLLAPADIIIEAVVERMDVKHGVLSTLDKVINADAILATNTSSIAIASLARSVNDTSRFIGLHFFNPAHIMKLVEVIRSPKTTDATVKKCMDFVSGLGKTPVLARDVPGFIVNRIARNFYNEAQRIVMEGASTVEQVDRSVKGLGFRMGPFELMNLIGVSTNLDVTTNQWEQFYFEPRFQPSLLQRQMVDAGLPFGEKS